MTGDSPSKITDRVSRAMPLRGTRFIFVSVLGLVFVQSVGCAPSIRWKAFTYEPGAAGSSSSARPELVYFRAWYSVECTRFEDNVLRNPTAVEAVQDFDCYMVEYDWHEKVAQTWGVREVPGFVILSPDGFVMAKRSGPISLDEFLESVRMTRQVMTEPAPRPPTSRDRSPGETPPRNPSSPPPAGRR